MVTSGTTNLLCFITVHVSTYLQVIFRPFDKTVRNCRACWDPIMFTRIKLVKYIKCLCQSAGRSWECCTCATGYCVVLFLEDASSAVVAFCCLQDALLGPVFLMHVWLLSCGIVVCVFFELDISMIFCVFAPGNVTECEAVLQFVGIGVLGTLFIYILYT